MGEPAGAGIEYKSLEQRLFLDKTFMKNKARGRAARTDAAQLLSELNALGPALTKQQVSSHTSMLTCRWNSDHQSVLRITETRREQVGTDVGGDAVEGEVDEGLEVDEVMQRVQEAAEELMNKYDHRQLRTMAGDGYAGDDISDGESCSDVGCQLSEDGDELEGMTQAVTRCCRRRVVASVQASGRARAREPGFRRYTELRLKRCSVFPSRSVHSASVASACCQPALTQVIPQSNTCACIV